MAARRTSSGYSLDALLRDLKKRVLRPVYVIEGEEALLASEATSAIVDAALGAEGRDFNLNIFSGDDESARDFLAQARSYPFLAERRAVVVRRFERLALRGRDEEAFLEYLRRPSASTVLVLVATALDRRTTLAKTLDGAACVVHVEPLKDAALAGWVRQRAAARGVELVPAACERLVELAGPALLDLENEIHKLAVRYAGARVGTAEVEATVGAHRAEEVWAINRAFRQDRPADFLGAFGRVLEGGGDENPVRLAAVLARHVNDLLRVKLMLERGKRQGDIAEHLKRQPWIVGQLVQQAQLFTRAELQLWLRNLQRADVLMKSAKLPQRLVLERALLNSFLEQELA